jgi:hypothetical protein
MIEGLASGIQGSLDARGDAVYVAACLSPSHDSRHVVIGKKKVDRGDWSGFLLKFDRNGEFGSGGYGGGKR